jgi:OmpA-OmpF porin, OOP family
VKNPYLHQGEAPPYAFDITTQLTANIPIQEITCPFHNVNIGYDSPLLGRFKGSFIVSYDHKEYDEFTLPLSMLEPVEGKSYRDLAFFAPKQKKDLIGAVTRLVYVLPENASPLEVISNYQQEIKEKGGEILYECKAEGCGGDHTKSASSKGDNTILALFLRPIERLVDPNWSTGDCAQSSRINDQRYMVGTLVESGAYVSTLVYTLKESPNCDKIVNRTVTVVDIIVPKQREQKMVTV